MEQSEFSKLAETYIQEHYSEVVSNINYQDDGSFDCLITSNKKLLSIWIATYDIEITVGFESADGENGDWHTHMSLWNANNPEEELIAMSQLIDSITSDSDSIVFSTKRGYYLPDYVDEEMRKKDENEIITIYMWSDL